MKRKRSKQIDHSDLLEARWLNNYAALRAFKKTYGTVHIGIEHKKRYAVLYRWVKAQRELKADGKLHPIREEKLNKINFIWNLKDLIWDQFYQQAKAYYKKNGSINMTEKFKARNKQLSKWMDHQREYLLHKKHHTEERIRKLKAIGFNKRNYRDSWNTKYDLLKQFYKEHKHFDTSSSKILDKWVIMQRGKKLSGRITHEHIELLDKIKFPWKNIYRKTWELELMQKWAKKRGEKCLSKKYVDSLTPLEWECKNGHRFKKSRDRYKQEKNCYQCDQIELREKHLKTIKQIAVKKSGKCLSHIYTDLTTKLEFKCKKGHIWNTTPLNIIYRDSWCPHCYGRLRKTIKKVVKKRS